MARDVTHDEHGPYMIDKEDFEEQGDVAICQCGLSDDSPHCDGSHRATRDEEEGVVYRYENDDSEGERTVVREE